MDSRSIALQIEKCRAEIARNDQQIATNEKSDDDYDWSYPAPEKQLLWRLDDLQERLEELIADGAPYRDEYIFLENDIKYALPDDLCDICKVERAIELAKDDLVNKYGLLNPNTLVFEVPEKWKETLRQRENASRNSRKSKRGWKTSETENGKNHAMVIPMQKSRASGCSLQN